MLAEEDRAELEMLLRQVGPAIDVAVQLEALDEAASSFRCRNVRRKASARIGEVIAQLSALVAAAHQAARTGAGSIPSEILPETFDALIGHYPFSNMDMAPVTAETLNNSDSYASFYRTAVIAAPVESHVVNAALRQFPGKPHLVAVRSTAFPFDAARVYFFNGLAEPTAADLRRQLEDFIVRMTDVAPGFLEHVRDRVCLATRDPRRQNRGRRKLYDWAEPSPEARLVWDVLDAVLQPVTERPNAPVRDIVVRIVDLLAEPIAADSIRPDIISAMVTIWVASCQHHIVARHLSGMLDGAPGQAETPRRRRRRSFWIACHGAVCDSAAELWRRACMGDHHHVAQLGGNPKFFDARSASPVGGVSGTRQGRATGFPVPTLDLAAAATAETTFRFLRSLAKACAPCLRPQAEPDVLRR
ncbi:hypothetical protein JQ617_10015 [Bradyrhizobium sp. KB893862 SZCCT0404]|uniref:hypothetical protein n=1 Tax=Bradyrhizobium sp. KB893862 SZCCT0404 TaxID=2807672 RepID=UPI001BA83528|nr:hypothetical protein [Bradyrhizobium sp. KB893862 SZCCT0404]MBR1174288.1 hypothetical protein [Bradyrhizobium sp. KB893862 SZCCT0404]